MNIILEKYLKRCKRKNYTQTTIKNYELIIVKFMEYFNIKEYSQFNELTSSKVEEFLDFLSLESKFGQYKASTRNARIREILAFNNYLLDNEESGVTKNFARGVEKAKEVKTDPTFYTDIEIEKIMSTAKGNILKAKTEAKEQAQENLHTMLKLFMETGMRKDELLSLNINQIANVPDENGDYDLQINGKGSKKRTIFISSDLREDLLYTYTNKLTKINDLIFTTSKGKKYSSSQLNTMFKALKKQAGIEEINGESRMIHTLRKTCARRWHEMGYSIEDIRYMLGHSNIETTMLYFKADKYGIKKKTRNIRNMIGMTILNMKGMDKQ